MKVSDLIYAMAGEIEDAAPEDSQQDILFVTDDRRRFEPVAVVSDGELVIVNVREVQP